MYRYLLTMVVVWRLYGGCMAVVWRKSHIAAYPDILTVLAARIANSKCFPLTTLQRSFLVIAVVFLISSGGMGRNNNLVSVH